MRFSNLTVEIISPTNYLPKTPKLTLQRLPLSLQRCSAVMSHSLQGSPCPQILRSVRAGLSPAGLGAQEFRMGFTAPSPTGSNHRNLPMDLPRARSHKRPNCEGVNAGSRKSRVYVVPGALAALCKQLLMAIHVWVSLSGCSTPVL